MSTLADKALQPIFYVYVYLDPTKPGLWKAGHYKFQFEPFYVGKGHGKRSTGHLRTVLKGKTCSRNPHKSRRIAKIIRDSGKEPIIRLLQMRLTEEEALDLEAYIILKLGRRCLGTGPLTNRTDGGVAFCGRVISKKERKKMSEVVKLIHSSRTPEEYAELNAALCRGQQRRRETEVVSEQTRTKMSKSCSKRWKNMTDEERQKLSDKRSDSQKIRFSNITPEETIAKEEARRITLANRTPEQIEYTRKAMCKAATKRQSKLKRKRFLAHESCF